MIELTAEALRKIFPKAPQPIIDAFVAKQIVLDRAGVNHTRNRLAYAFAQVEHESSGFTRLRENINYTPERAAKIWPSRFKSAADCLAKVGSWDGDAAFKVKLIDQVYGGRMGNRPGTHDGSVYIGRSGSQLTGRDCYAAVGKAAGIDLVGIPQLAERAENQPECLAGFIDWKNLNAKADIGDFRGYVKVWNGGLIGIADREAQLAGNDPFIKRLSAVNSIAPQVNDLPGRPPTAAPPKEAIDATTVKERAARTAGTAGAATGGAAETAKTTTGTGLPDKPLSPFLSPMVTFALIGVGLAVVIVASVVIAKKAALVKANWN